MLRSGFCSASSPNHLLMGHPRTCWHEGKRKKKNSNNNYDDDFFFYFFLFLYMIGNIHVILDAGTIVASSERSYSTTLSSRVFSFSHTPVNAPRTFSVS